MNTIAGCEIKTKVYESPNSLVYRAVRKSDQTPVILKLLKEGYPSRDELIRYRQEYEIMRHLNLPGVINVYGQERYGNTLVIILEDFGGESLKILGQNESFSLNLSLSLAIRIAKILGEVHEKNVIHKDINPSNIIYNPATDQLKIIDFGLSTKLTREFTLLKTIEQAEGTLDYISPEQTGRMNRALDYRTDYYALGATFYELFTGRPPFDAREPLELVHCHLARRPATPRTVNPKISENLSHIVMKLLAKRAEERYQTSRGLIVDLEFCLRESNLNLPLESNKFIPGAKDISERFQLPEQLFGREKELQILLATAERAASGKGESIFIAGYSGVGKSALVGELYKPLAYRRGYILTGKFDQFHRNIPYSAVRTAFRELMRQLVSESEERLLQWKQKILEALGNNGRLLTDFLPELTLIIGEQGPVAKLDATASRNRFTMLLGKFVRAFCSREHPLVLFLDDLQWADLASLKFIELLATGAEFILLLGAYRDNEVSAGHPLLVTMETIKESETPTKFLTLSPLNSKDVQRYMAEVTRDDGSHTERFAGMVLEKTGGNPFFMGEFLKTLHRLELLYIDRKQGRWLYDLDRIREQKISDNVVELMSRRIDELEPGSREVLKAASCLGNIFSLKKLAIIHEKTSTETAHDLWPCLMAGLVLPRGNVYKIADLGPETPESGYGNQEYSREPILYKFAHDRIEEAAYALIPEEKKQAKHLQIGRLLLEKTPENERPEHIFAIVDHLNQGYGEGKTHENLEDKKELLLLAQLNLDAGRRAQASTAYEPALRYCRQGLFLLGERGWEDAYELALELNSQAVEAAFLAGAYSEMDGLAQVALERAANVTDCAKVHELRIQSYMVRNEPRRAVDTALDVLKQLGVTLPEELRPLQKPPESFLELPTMRDPVGLTSIRILYVVLSSAYGAAPELLPLIILKMVELSLEYGNVGESCYAFAFHGVIVGAIMGDVELGYSFGRLAMDLLEQGDYESFRARVTFIFYVFLEHRKTDLARSIQPMRDSYLIGLDTGDLEFSGYSALNCCIVPFMAGKEVGNLIQESSNDAVALEGYGQKAALVHLNIFRQALLNLRGDSEQESGSRGCYSLLAGAAFDERKMVLILEEAKDLTALCYVYFNKLNLSCIFLDFKQAILDAADTETYLGSWMGGIGVPVFHFNDSLARLGVYVDASQEEQSRIREKVKDNLEVLEKWAAHAPMNYEHRINLVKAEEARVLGRIPEAHGFYQKSIEQARGNEYLGDEARAWELAGRYYKNDGLLDFAHLCLKNAHYAFTRWGADARVRHMEELYPEVFSMDTGGHDPGVSSSISNANMNLGGVLDLTTLIKSSQAISGEIVLESLLKRLMRLVIENAGAQKGYFLLEKQGTLYLEAVAETDGSSAETASEAQLQSRPIRDEEFLPLSLLDYTLRTGKLVVLANAHDSGDFRKSAYIRKNNTASVLCLPVRNQGRVMGLLYLENNLTTGAFTAGHVNFLEILVAQVSVSIENARLYSNLEEKVQERTRQLQTALGEVRALKDQQDGDYYLTSLLLEPLCENTASDNRIHSDILIQQFKRFQYQKWTAEIGGDVCVCHDVFLNSKTYTLFLNGDAMGKSIQGAGGSLVLLAALKALLQKMQASPALQNQSPQSWLAGAYMELCSIFATFKGSMQLTLIMGLADGEKKLLTFFNAGHPQPVLLRRGVAEYFAQGGVTYKLGDIQDDPPLSIETLQLESGDVVLMGSDGKDDLDLGRNAEGVRIINDDKALFLDCVSEGQGELERIKEKLLERGSFIDDFSLLRLVVE